MCTVGDNQYRRNIMMHVGDIMSTVGLFSTVGKHILFFYSVTTE